jgi:predicted metal-dependent hydrolase
MEQIIFGNKKIKFDIKRGRRKKTLGLEVRPDSSVVVLSPYFLDKDKIKTIVLKRASWIVQKQENVRLLNIEQLSREFVSGESFPYLGREYRLKVIRTAGEDSICKLAGGRLYVEINSKLSGQSAARVVRGRLSEWYLKCATDKINDRVYRYSKLIGRVPKRIIIKDQKKRWGSCSHAGVLRFNWRIIMAPISVLDYVIVHELCHLHDQNHSPEFWQRVSSIIPDYKNRREWLKAGNISFIL